MLIVERTAHFEDIGQIWHNKRQNIYTYIMKFVGKPNKQIKIILIMGVYS